MIYLDVDTALAEVPVNSVPLTDDTDFKTIEESVAYNASGLELIWHFVTSAGATSATVVTPTTGGAYDWAHQDGGMYTIEIPASGGASINNDTEGYGYFTGKATGVLPWRGPTIGFRAAAINDALMDGGDVLDVSVTEWKGSAAPDAPPSNAQLEARTLVAANYFDPATDAVANVTLVATTTNLTNLPTIPSNWLTAAGIASSALDGKGNWNVGKTGYTLTATTGLGDQTANITGNLSGSVGSVTGNVGGNVVGSVASVTGNVATLAGSATVVLTDASLTTAKLGTFALAKGANITGFNDITAAQVEAAILDEGDATALLAAIAAKVEEFLVNEGDATATIAAIATATNAAIAAGTVGSNVSAIKAKTDNLPASPASTTNITAGTITTVTNLTNAPTNGDLTATMKASVTTAATAATPTAAAVTGNVGGNVVGSIGSLATQAKADVNTEVDTALADYDGPTNAEMVARTLAAAAYATAANQATIAGYVDTEVAAIKAVTDKLDTALESDGGAGYQFTTTALENGPSGSIDLTPVTDVLGTPTDTDVSTDIANLQAAVDALNVASGTGAHAGVITVDDGTDPVQSARVYARLNGILKAYGVTDVDGEIDAFRLDPGTYDIAILAEGHLSFASDGGLVVGGDDWSDEYSLTSVTPLVPDNPDAGVISVLCVDGAGNTQEGIIVSYKLAEEPSGDTGYGYDGDVLTVVSDVNGLAQLPVVKLAVYLIKRGDTKAWRQITADDAATSTTISFVGS